MTDREAAGLFDDDPDYPSGAELLRVVNETIFHDRPDLQYRFDRSAPPLIRSENRPMTLEQRAREALANTAHRNGCQEKTGLAILNEARLDLWRVKASDAIEAALALIRQENEACAAAIEEVGTRAGGDTERFCRDLANSLRARLTKESDNAE